MLKYYATQTSVAFSQVLTVPMTVNLKVRRAGRPYARLGLGLGT